MVVLPYSKDKARVREALNSKHKHGQGTAMKLWGLGVRAKLRPDLLS